MIIRLTRNYCRCFLFGCLAIALIRPGQDWEQWFVPVITFLAGMAWGNNE